MRKLFKEMEEKVKEKRQLSSVFNAAEEQGIKIKRERS